MPAPTPNTPIDAVNDRDEAVGTVPRGEALQLGQNFRTAHIFILNGSGELLLQRLAAQRDRHPGRWGSSVAAYLFAGESYEEGAARRMWEELGVSVPLQPLGKIEMQDLNSLKFVSLFFARSDVADIRERAHIAELRFWPLGEITASLLRNPSSFTPTFLRLFGAFGARLS
jgi:isopentenyl-diphosphate delta-isomerase